MAELMVERVYSEALFDAADSLGIVGEVRSELKELQGVFKEFPEFFELLHTPAISAEEKKKSVDTVFGGKLRPQLINFLYVLVDKRRVGCYDGIVKSYGRLADEKKGLVKGVAVSAVPLEEKQISALAEEAGRMFSKNVELENVVDPSIIGGVRVYIEGRMIDASIRKKLDDLKERIV